MKFVEIGDQHRDHNVRCQSFPKRLNVVQQPDAGHDDGFTFPTGGRMGFGPGVRFAERIIGAVNPPAGSSRRRHAAPRRLDRECAARRGLHRRSERLIP